jgi:hypothetical protein
MFAFAIKRRVSSRQSAWRLEDWHQVFGSEGDELMRQLVTRLYRWGQNPHEGCIEHLLLVILQFRPTAAILNALYADKVQPLHNERTSVASAVDTWVLFVDRIDEALADHSSLGALLGADLENAYIDNDKVTRANVSQLAQHVWTCSQAGYAIAAHKLRSQSNGQLVVLGTIRAEAYQTFIDKIGLTQAKVQSFLLRLDADERTMRSIFNLNVGLMVDRCDPGPGPKLTDPDIKADVGLFGCQSLFSRSVFGYQEAPYAFLRRHTFGTPRGLMSLGGAAARVRTTNRPGISGATWRPPEQIMQAVSKAAVEVFEEYRDNLYPRWDADYEKGFPLLRSNIIPRHEIFREGGIEDQFRALCGGKPVSLVGYLHSTGLVGLPSRSPTGQWRQTFWTPGHESAVLPTEFEYAMLHPAFSAFLLHRVPRPSGAMFDNPQVVVAPGDLCPPKLRDQTLRLIFHCTNNSAAVSCEKQLPSGAKELFGTANNVGSAFLTVLAVAHRVYGAGHLGRDKLQNVAVRLARLGFIRERLGKAAVAGKVTGKTPEEWIEHICDRSAGESEATAVTNAKALLDTGIGLTIDTRNDDETGDRFCLFWTAAPLPRPMERDEISVEGLSIDAFLGATPDGVPL